MQESLKQSPSSSPAMAVIKRIFIVYECHKSFYVLNL